MVRATGASRSRSARQDPSVKELVEIYASFAWEHGVPIAVMHAALCERIAEINSFSIPIGKRSKRDRRLVPPSRASFHRRSREVAEKSASSGDATDGQGGRGA